MRIIICEDAKEDQTLLISHCHHFHGSFLFGRRKTIYPFKNKKRRVQSYDSHGQQLPRRYI